MTMLPKMICPTMGPVHTWPSLFVALALFVAAGPQRIVAQDGSLLHQPLPSAAGAGLTLKNSSFIYRELPVAARTRELQLYDIVTIVVDYSTLMISQGDTEQRKTANLNAVLADWLRWDGKNIKPAPQSDGDPRIRGSLTSQYRAESDMQTRDSLKFKIAARVVAIRPNGNLVIEAHREIRNNEEVWVQTLSGVVRREAIQADRTVRSDAVANLRIDKYETGAVRDGYARGWFKRLHDKFKAF